MTISFEINQPTYKVVPTFNTIGRGKSKRTVLEKISCVLNLHKSITVNGVITKHNIDEIPQMEKLGVDLCSHFVKAMLDESITKINDLFDMKLSYGVSDDFYEEYQDVFIEFTNELKNIIKKKVI